MRGNAPKSETEFYSHNKIEENTSTLFCSLYWIIIIFKFQPIALIDINRCDLTRRVEIMQYVTLGPTLAFKYIHFFFFYLKIYTI